MQDVKFDFEGTEIIMNMHDDPDHLSNAIKKGNTFYELDLLNAIRAVYDGKSCIVDAGANIGNHSIFFSKVLGAQVISFEPFPRNIEILRKNISDNNCDGKVDLKPYALGELPSRAVGKAKSRKNLGSVTINIASDGDIEIVRLDDVLDTTLQIGVMKIDVEGFEIPLLKGSLATITRHMPHLFIEAHLKAELAALKELLSPLGYQPVARYCATPTYHFKPPAPASIAAPSLLPQ